MASRLLWDKGVGEFVEAARQIRELNVPARFLIAGERDEGNPACIPEATIDEWKSEGVVEFLGHRLDMPQLLREAHIATLPSYHEGISLFLLEALASGLPLVTSDLDGCRMVVQDGVNGFLVLPRRADLLAQALLKLLTDPKLRSDMGKSSRQLAVDEFCLHHIQNQYLTLYRGLGVMLDMD